VKRVLAAGVQVLLVDAPEPAVGRGDVLVQTINFVVSTGT